MGAVNLFRRLFGGIPCVSRRVIVNLADDRHAFAGVLWSQRGDWLVLKQATLLQPGREAVPMDGDVVIECARVLFVQVVAA